MKIFKNQKFVFKQRVHAPSSYAVTYFLTAWTIANMLGRHGDEIRYECAGVSSVSIGVQTIGGNGGTGTVLSRRSSIVSKMASGHHRLDYYVSVAAS